MVDGEEFEDSSTKIDGKNFEPACLFIVYKGSTMGVGTIYGTPNLWQSGTLAPGTLAPEI